MLQSKRQLSREINGNNIHLHCLAGEIKRGLIGGFDSDQIVGLENRVSGIEGLGLGRGIDADGEARVLTEGGGEWDSEEVAVEVGGEGERGKNVEESGEC